MMKNHNGKDIVGIDDSTKVLGPGIVRKYSGGTKIMKIQCSNSHTHILWRQVAYKLVSNFTVAYILVWWRRSGSDSKKGSNMV